MPPRHTKPIKLYQPDWLPELLLPKRYKALYGGRGGGKSWGIATALVYLASRKSLFIVCGRQVQNSLADSSKKLLEDTIELLGWGEYFRITKSEIVCPATGARFVFKGFTGPYASDAFKSLEGCDILWLEEAHSITQEVIEKAFPTVRTAGSEIWLSWNPENDTDAVHERFVIKDPGSNAWIKKLNWYNNPFVSKELLDEKEFMRLNFPTRYRAVWLGHTGLVEHQIFNPAWWSFYADMDEVIRRVTRRFITVDTAFETKETDDYSALQLWGMEGRKRLYFLDEIFGKWEWPELLSNARTFYSKHAGKKSRGNFAGMYIEKRASGHSLIQTLRREKIKALPWLPKQFSFPDNKTAAFKEASYIVAPAMATDEAGRTYIPEGATGDVWLPSGTIYPESASFVSHCAAISADESQEYDDRADCMKMAVSIWRKQGGGRKSGKDKLAGN